MEDQTDLSKKGQSLFPGMTVARGVVSRTADTKFPKFGE